MDKDVNQQIGYYHPKCNHCKVYDAHTKPSDPLLFAMGQNEMPLDIEIVAVEKNDAQGHNSESNPIDNQLNDAGIFNLQIQAYC